MGNFGGGNFGGGVGGNFSGFGNTGGTVNFSRSQSMMEPPALSPNSVQGILSLQSKLQPLLQERSMLNNSGGMNMAPAVRQQRIEQLNTQIASIKLQFEHVAPLPAPSVAGGGLGSSSALDQLQKMISEGKMNLNGADISRLLSQMSMNGEPARGKRLLTYLVYNINT